MRILIADIQGGRYSALFYCMKKIILLIIAFILVLAFSACTGDTLSGTTLTYGSSDIVRINPAMDEHGEINPLLFDGLTDRDKNNEIIPCLAESWVYDESNYTYTFSLRDDVKWHDGERFTAHDVKFTFEAIMNPDNHSEIASNYEEVESITVADDFTVSFRLSAPNFAFLDYMTMPILPEHLLAGENMQTSDFFLAPVGTGPYVIKEREEGQAIILTKNEGYFLGAAAIDNIVFRIVGDDISKALMLKSGELDLAQVSPADAQGIKEEPGLTVYRMKTADYRGIMYNFANEYWQRNADLIPAINYAVDRQSIADSVLLGCGQPADSPIQLNKYNYDGVEKYEYNPARAEQLLLSAGCVKREDGFCYRNGEKIGFTVNVNADDRVRIDMAMAASQQLRAIGVDMKVAIPETVDWSAQEAYLIGWGSPFDADDHTYKVFGTGKGANYSSYSNPAADRYLTEARRTSDEALRADAYKNFQIEFANNPAYTLLCYIDALYAARDNISGIDKDVVLGHHGVGIFNNITEWTINN